MSVSLAVRQSIWLNVSPSVRLSIYSHFYSSFWLTVYTFLCIIVRLCFCLSVCLFVNNFKQLSYLFMSALVLFQWHKVCYPFLSAYYWTLYLIFKIASFCELKYEKNMVLFGNEGTSPTLAPSCYIPLTHPHITSERKRTRDTDIATEINELLNVYPYIYTTKIRTIFQ